MVRIVPAILTDDPHQLALMIRQAERFASYIQVDITDGIFVPSRSVTAKDMEKARPKVNWEAHLMVANPEEHLLGFKKAGAKKVIFHYEAVTQHSKVIAKARSLDLEVGLGINPETSINDFIGLIPYLDSVLFLSVHPGFYGSPFIPQVLDKVIALKSIFPNFMVGIDGGVSDKNILTVLKSGVDDICIGSAIFRSSDPEASYQRLSEIIGGEH